MSRRRLSPEERTLWTDVTRSIARLRPDVDAPEGDAAAPPPPSPAKAKAKFKTKFKPLTAVAPSTPAPKSSPRAVPAPLGRKAKRRLSRGADEIHGRLDLHGMTQAEAYDALLGYLRSSQARGAKVVLVITGKGGRGDASSEPGVLKRQVPMWLRLPDFRDMVIAFEAAGGGHGGEGALYVRLRRIDGRQI